MERPAGTSAALYATVSTTTTQNAVPEDAKAKAHHLKDGKGFTNPWPSFRDFTPTSILWAMLKRKFSGKQNSPDTSPANVPAVRTPQFLPTRETPELRATWLGHACYFVEFPGGLRVLFDPVFEPRCSPFTFMGPKRYTAAPCHVENIPIIDAVVISHSHYDHLEKPTISKLAKTHPNVHFFVPLGLRQWFNDNGVTKVTELDWWDQCNLHLSAADSDKHTTTKDGASSLSQSSVTSTNTTSPTNSGITSTISCLPNQHVSARTPFNKCQTLWASWGVESGGKKIYFAGDTGYRTIPDAKLAELDYDHPDIQGLPHCPAFKEIGQHRGPFDLGLIPIGAYDPREIMSAMHANPYDSVEIFKDTKCKRAMGIHWGTWVLTEEDVMEPPKLLKQVLKLRGMPQEGVFDVCEIGESREFA